jgi:signal transduction histidine kinase/CheY-like chemotaxis protein
MSYGSNLSIGQRMAAGFGLLFVILGALIAVLVTLIAQNSASQKAYAETIAPRAARAELLERAVLYVGLATRGYLLEPSEGGLRALEDSLAGAADSMRRLGELPLDAQTRARYRELLPLFERYLRESMRTAEQRAAGALEDVAGLRETLLASVRGFVEIEGRRGAEALAEMSANRDTMVATLLGASLLAALLLVVIGHFTTQAVRRPVRALVRVASALQAGNWKPALELAPSSAAAAERTQRNEILRLGQAFGAAAVSLEAREHRLRAHRDIAGAISGSLQKESIAAPALAAILQYLGAEVGALYHRDGQSGVLHPIARQALEDALPDLMPGEGIPGQAAREGRLVILEDFPDDTPFRIKLGYDAAPPRTVAAVPIRFQEEVIGVVVVASLRELGREGLEFLRGAALQLAIGLKNAQAFENIQRLATELEDKSERIQQQNEELQAQNEEIQAQNEEIQAQNEEIQAQNEEIQAQNEELLQQTEAVRRHAELLGEADRRKNEFLGVLAHELRNPLAPMSNSMQLLQRVPADSEQGSRARAILERQIAHLSRLIDDLLDVTRISRGKIELRRERLDLSRVLNECLADHWNALEHNDVALELDLPDTPVWVDADHTRLCQVLGNLLANAVKFTGKNGRIGVSVRLLPDARQVALRVADSGIGIDSFLLPRVFEPFSQGESELARSQGGLGLGLALVKALVEMHGGSVEARSDGPDRGAEFVVRLPLHGSVHAPGEARTDAQVLALPPQERPDAARQARHRKRRRVLVIEDNLDAAVSLKDVLDAEGHEVELAYSGPEGLEKARAFMPDVVLCDIGLPGFDGYELGRRLRADPKLGTALLVAVTGYATHADQERAAAAGFDRHLAKPADIATLLGLLDDSERLGAKLPEAFGGG